MRRSIVLSLPLQLVFPGVVYGKCFITQTPAEVAPGAPPPSVLRPKIIQFFETFNQSSISDQVGMFIIHEAQRP
jgi:hypothetical protein